MSYFRDYPARQSGRAFQPQGVGMHGERPVSGGIGKRREIMHVFDDEDVVFRTEFVRLWMLSGQPHAREIDADQGNFFRCQGM